MECDVGARCGGLLALVLQHGTCSDDRTHSVYENPFADLTVFKGSRKVRGLARSVSDTRQV